jgi:hypothetical protein
VSVRASWSRLLVLGVLMLGALGGLGARAAAAETVVLVEVPPPIIDAVRSSLAPWQVELVIVPEAPAAYEPRPLALEHQAGFVVWRRGDELILYDAALVSEERRPLPEPGEPGAVAMALSIKAWMGLGTTAGCEPRCPVERGWTGEVGLGARGAPAEQGGVSLRFGLAAGYRYRRFEVGGRLEFGLDRAGTALGASGAWTRFAAGGWARYGWPVGRRFTVAPGAGLGLVRVGFVAPRTGPGTQGVDVGASAVAVDVDLGLRWRRGPLVAGLRIGLTMVPGDVTLRDRGAEVLLAGHLEPWAVAGVGLHL